MRNSSPSSADILDGFQMKDGQLPPRRLAEPMLRDLLKRALKEAYDKGAVEGSRGADTRDFEFSIWYRIRRKGY